MYLVYYKRCSPKTIKNLFLSHVMIMLQPSQSCRCGSVPQGFHCYVILRWDCWSRQGGLLFPDSMHLKGGLGK